MRKISFISIGIFMILLPFAVYAADETGEEDLYITLKGINDTLMINIGSFVPALNTNIRIDDPDTKELGTVIGFEDLLAMDDSLFVFRADGHVRLSRYLGIEFGYYNLSRDAITAINETIKVADEKSSVNSLVESRFGTEVIKTAFKISVINDGRTELGFSVGANVVFLDAYLHWIAAGEGDDNEGEESVEEVIPLPLLGLHGTFTIIPGLFLKGNFQFFTLALDEFEGSSIDFRAALEYYPAKNLGVGIGINHFNFNLEVDSDDILGMFDYSYTGIIGYISLVI
jgi:hypothetical protein